MQPTFRPVERADVPAVSALLAAVFDDNPKAEPARYVAQYLDSPGGPPLSWVAEYEGVVVGHAGLVRLDGHVGGRACSLGHAGDAAVHPSWRGRGVYGELARRRLEGARGAGLAAVMSIPNDRSRPTSVREGLVLQHRLRAWIGLPLPWTRGLGHALQAGDAHAVLGEGDWWPGPDVTGIARTAGWATWRYPVDGTYRWVAVAGSHGPDGLAVLADQRRAGLDLTYLLDVWSRDAHGIGRVLSAVVAGERRACALLATPGGELARAAQRAGWLRLPGVLEPQPQHLGLAGWSEGRDERWHVTWGDHDHL